MTINNPHLNALDNVAFPLVRAGMDKHKARERAAQMLKKVQLGHLTDRKPGELSGGQQQRVAIARALAKDASVLLLDEPFVNLDYKLREELREELVELLAGNDRVTVLYATTEPREALQMGTEVLVMDKGHLIQAQAPAPLFAAPANVDVARIVSDPPINILPLVLSGGRAQIEGLGQQDALPLLAGLPDGPYFLGLRAGNLRVAIHGTPMTVRLTEVNGSETLTYLDLNGTEVMMHEKAVTDHAFGQVLNIHTSFHDALVFDKDGRHLPVATTESEV